MRLAAKLKIGLLAFVGLAVVVVVLGMAFGLLDMVAAVADDHAGLLTSRAIRAVQAEREGPETIGEVVARQLGDHQWSAVHDDDDSLFSVRVTALSHHPKDVQWAEWCVFYRFSPTGHLGVRVDAIIPASRTAQLLAPGVGMRLQPLPGGGPWSCTALRIYYAPGETRGRPTRG